MMAATKNENGGITIVVDAELTKFNSSIDSLKKGAEEAGRKIKVSFAGVDTQFNNAANSASNLQGQFRKSAASVNSFQGNIISLTKSFLPGAGLAGAITLAASSLYDYLTNAKQAEEITKTYASYVQNLGGSAINAASDFNKLRDAIINASNAELESVNRQAKIDFSSVDPLLNQYRQRRLIDSENPTLGLENLSDSESAWNKALSDIGSAQIKWDEFREQVFLAEKNQIISHEQLVKLLESEESEAKKLYAIAERLSLSSQKLSGTLFTDDFVGPNISDNTLSSRRKKIASGSKSKKTSYTGGYGGSSGVFSFSDDIEGVYAAVRKENEAFLEAQKAIDQNNKKLENDTLNLSSALDTASSALADFVLTGKGGFDDMAMAIAKMITQMLIFQGLKTGMNAIGLGSLFGSAKGNAFSAGSGLSSYRNSIVSTPTVFPFAHGVGLMGEKAGSPGEAIMPLMRMSGGDLGVKVQGDGGGMSVVNNFEQSFAINVDGTNKGGDQISEEIAKSIGNQMQRQINALVDQRLITQSRPGGLLNQGIH